MKCTSWQNLNSHAMKWVEHILLFLRVQALAANTKLIYLVLCVLRKINLNLNVNFQVKLEKILYVMLG